MRFLLHGDAAGMKPGTAYSYNRGNGPEGPGVFRQYGHMGGFLVEPGGIIRTGAWRDGRVTPGAFNVYLRAHSEVRVRPPYAFGGRMFVHSRQPDPWLEFENRAPTWDWGIVWHPIHVDNNNNMVIGIGNSKQLAGAAGASWSAEIDHKYGLRTGFELRDRKTPIPNPIDGRWHDWRIDVPAVGEFLVWWDGERIARFIEQQPASFDAAAPVGMRLDFFDVSLADTYIDTTPGRTTVHGPTLRDGMTPITPTRILDTRGGRRPVAGSITSAKLPAAFPPDVKAVAVTATIVAPVSPTHITVWGMGGRPEASTQNADAGEVRAGFTICELGPDRTIRVFTHASSHLLLDVVALWR